MQQYPLLQTKLHIPPIRPELVPRPRLVERLDTRLDRKLTLVSAPAGFGKTTLLGEWASNVDRRKADMAWLSLDDGDNDPARFWAYVIAALQTVRPGMGEACLVMLQSLQPPDVETIVTGLLNEITQVPEPIVLVLDDYHVIETKAIHTSVAFALDHLPPQLQLIIATRSDPPLPVSRLRGRGQLSELRTEDLRFTTSEAATFLNKVMGLQLSAKDVAVLESRTEGWIVGLQMAALSLQGRDRLDATRAIGAFTGSHRFILDYLSDEVISQQPEEVQAFLLSTAILERLSGSLCDHVTGQDNGQEMLERLDAANLFVIPLDDERRWYRYHHLFATLLQSRLEQAQPDMVPALHLRASEWYEANSLLPEAVRHALAANDLGRVATMLEGNALALMDSGRLKTSLDWLSTLPPEVVRSRPWLCVTYAWALVHTSSFAEALACLDEYESEERATEHVESSAHVAGHINAIRFYMASLKPFPDEEAEQYAHQALALLPEEDLRTRGLIAVILGLQQRMNLEYAAARETLSEMLLQARAAGQGYAVVDLLCQLARVEANQGELHRAASTCREALQAAEAYGGTGGQRLPVVSYAHVSLAGILREWNQLHDAERHAEAAIELSRRWGQAGSLVNGYFVLLAIQVAQADLPSALETIRRMRQLDAPVWERYGLWMEDREVNARLAFGDVDYATWQAKDRDLEFSNGTHWLHAMKDLTLVRIRIAQYNRGEVQNLDDTIAYLAHAMGQLEKAEAWRGIIELLVLQAMAHQALGDKEQSLATLSRALSLAEPEGYVRIFIDEGEPMAGMLREAATRGVKPSYAASLLAAFETEREDQEHETGLDLSSLGTPPSALIEPLSERELEVLRLLAAGLSNREIAEQLFLAVGTVKKYTSNIYGKLGVHSRTMAAAKARELNLL
jgi:LuxR family maltose regulon positive regulatory protein